MGDVDHPTSGSEEAKPENVLEKTGTHENPEKVESPQPAAEEKPKAKKSTMAETKPTVDGSEFVLS